MELHNLSPERERREEYDTPIIRQAALSVQRSQGHNIFAFMYGTNPLIQDHDYPSTCDPQPSEAVDSEAVPLIDLPDSVICVEELEATAVLSIVLQSSTWDTDRVLQIVSPSLYQDWVPLMHGCSTHVIARHMAVLVFPHSSANGRLILLFFDMAHLRKKR